MTGHSRGSWTTVVAVLGALALGVPGAAQAQVPYPLDCEDLGSSKVTEPGPFKALPRRYPACAGRTPSGESRRSS
jgi:hypothetical protein